MKISFKNQTLVTTFLSRFPKSSNAFSSLMLARRSFPKINKPSPLDST
jgi:hypothetical protein